MRRHVRAFAACVGVVAGCAFCVLSGAGCQTPPRETGSEWTVRDAIEHYRAARADELGRDGASRTASGVYATYTLPGRASSAWAGGEGSQTAAWPTPAPGFKWTGAPSTSLNTAVLTLGSLGSAQESAATQATTSGPTSHPAAKAAGRAFVAPEGYWRQDLWHQMGHEALDLGRRDFWRGFKSSYWNLENALLLTATMGGSITIRGTGVDDTVRNRTHGSRALGSMSETLQIIGNPGTHFAAAGVLWLVSDLTRDVKEHEVAKALVQALAVNGVSTMVLKVSTNTRAPDGNGLAWPSGHTSSAFTAAAVLNEYYGPWVGLPSFALAGLVGYQRIDSRSHDFSDVVFGAMLGYVIGTSVARDDKAQFPELFGMKVVPYINPETGTSGLALLREW